VAIARGDRFIGRFDLWKNRRVTAGSSESGSGQVRTIFSSGHYYDSMIEKKIVYSIFGRKCDDVQVNHYISMPS